jgi:hypothetical protein
MDLALDRFVALDEHDGKVYIASQCETRPYAPDTMWVVDCATDSVLKKFESVHRGFSNQCIRWVPWSNRIYLVNIYPDAIHKSSIVVIDCNTDSVIVPGMLFSSSFTYDIQLDPIRERIFIIGVDTTDVYVLRDTGYEAVAEPKPAGPRPITGLQLQTTPGGYEVSYSVTSPCRVALTVYDLMGCEVRRLAAGQRAPGEHRAFWDCQDQNGVPVPNGVYCVRLEASDVTDVKKAVVLR